MFTYYGLTRIAPKFTVWHNLNLIFISFSTSGVEQLENLGNFQQNHLNWVFFALWPTYSNCIGSVIQLLDTEIKLPLIVTGPLEAIPDNLQSFLMIHTIVS